MNGRINGWMNGWIDDGCIDGLRWMDGWIVGWMDRRILDKQMDHRWHYNMKSSLSCTPHNFFLSFPLIYGLHLQSQG